MTDIEVDGLLDENELPRDQYLIFSVDNEYFGMDINSVIEIIGMELITTIPTMPEYIKGMINLRGKVIPVMDVRVRFQKKKQPYNDRTCIIVVEIENTFIGLIIDEVIEVATIDASSIMQPPKNGKEKDNKSTRYISGFVKTDDKIRLLIDGKKLIEKG